MNAGSGYGGPFSRPDTYAPQMDIPHDIQPLSQAFLRGLKAALGEKLHGVYLHGAAVFPDGGAVRDVDFNVIIKQPLTSDESRDLTALHADLKRLGPELDGHYFLLSDARRTAQPESQLVPGTVDDHWTLHRAHMRAGRCIVLHGPDPKEIYPATSWPELVKTLLEEMEYIEEHLHLFSYADYSVLNLCRVMYSFEAMDVVVSKRAASEWACDALPEWSDLIVAAAKSYDGDAGGPDEHLLRSETGRFVRFARDRIHRSSQRAGS